METIVLIFKFSLIAIVSFILGAVSIYTLNCKSMLDIKESFEYKDLEDKVKHLNVLLSLKEDVLTQIENKNAELSEKLAETKDNLKYVEKVKDNVKSSIKIIKDNTVGEVFSIDGENSEFLRDSLQEALSTITFQTEALATCGQLIKNQSNEIALLKNIIAEKNVMIGFKDSQIALLTQQCLEFKSEVNKSRWLGRFEGTAFGAISVFTGCLIKWRF